MKLNRSLLAGAAPTLVLSKICFPGQVLKSLTEFNKEADGVRIAALRSGIYLPLHPFFEAFGFLTRKLRDDLVCEVNLKEDYQRQVVCDDYKDFIELHFHPAAEATRFDRVKKANAGSSAAKEIHSATRRLSAALMGYTNRINKAVHCVSVVEGYESAQKNLDEVLEAYPAS